MKQRTGRSEEFELESILLLIIRNFWFHFAKEERFVPGTSALTTGKRDLKKQIRPRVDTDLLVQPVVREVLELIVIIPEAYCTFSRLRKLSANFYHFRPVLHANPHYLKSRQYQTLTTKYFSTA